MKLINAALNVAKASALATAKFGEVLTENHTMRVGKINTVMIEVLKATPLNTYKPHQRAEWFYAYTGICASMIMAAPDQDYEEAKFMVKEHLAWVRAEFNIPSLADSLEENANVRAMDVPGRLMGSRRIGKELHKNAKKAGWGYGLDYFLFQAAAASRMPGRFTDITQMQFETMAAVNPLTETYEHIELSSAH